MIYRRPERSQFYQYDFWLDGRRYQGSTKLADRRAAENYEAALRTKIVNREVGLIEKPRYSVNELLDRLKQRWQVEKKLTPQNLSLLKMVRADWGSKQADELTADDFEKYMLKRENAQYAVASTNRVFQVLRRAFKLADVNWPKFQLPKEQNTRAGFATAAQVEKLLTHLPDDGLRDFIQFLHSTGMRRGEASRIKWSYLQDGKITIPGKHCKNGRPHSIPVSGPLEAIIERRKVARAFESCGATALSEFVFHRGDGQPILEFRKSWRTATEAAGVGSLIPHDLRRSACSDMIRAGIPQSVAMKISGHESDSMFRRYGIVSDADMTVALEKTAAYRSKMA